MSKPYKLILLKYNSIKVNLLSKKLLFNKYLNKKELRNLNKSYINNELYRMNMLYLVGIAEVGNGMILR